MDGFLNEQNKNVMLFLAAEFDTAVSTDSKKVPIIQAILKASNYDEQMAKDMLEGILEKKVKLAEWERLDRLAEREEARQLVLEKARILNIADTNSLADTVSLTAESKDNKVNFKELVSKFDLNQLLLLCFL